ncbi:uncharacterized protein BXZ73DRAFT_81005 [Epithele typhae]|uniref:uncharacterized protein n=1 Tax=Epithele typhae TaxID=378194 RepID=UPI002007E6DB|nr:uncharacterized protein BXZ73DRAFT_81005 [Epithele typhae]KAH9916763.1 hypothetical protein BXZ73DRAFT_81005 [Epithele typhae]
MSGHPYSSQPPYDLPVASQSGVDLLPKTPEPPSESPGPAVRNPVSANHPCRKRRIFRGEDTGPTPTALPEFHSMVKDVSDESHNNSDKKAKLMRSSRFILDSSKRTLAEAHTSERADLKKKAQLSHTKTSSSTKPSSSKKVSSSERQDKKGKSRAVYRRDTSSAETSQSRSTGESSRTSDPEPSPQPLETEFQRVSITPSPPSYQPVVTPACSASAPETSSPVVAGPSQDLLHRSPGASHTSLDPASGPPAHSPSSSNASQSQPHPSQSAMPPPPLPKPRAATSTSALPSQSTSRPKPYRYGPGHSIKPYNAKKAFRTPFANPPASTPSVRKSAAAGMSSAQADSQVPDPAEPVARAPRSTGFRIGSGLTMSARRPEPVKAQEVGDSSEELWALTE